MKFLASMPRFSNVETKSSCSHTQPICLLALIGSRPRYVQVLRKTAIGARGRESQVRMSFSASRGKSNFSTAVHRLCYIETQIAAREVNWKIPRMKNNVY
jgi:hypothetical protein